jgi:hypothetical protein
MLPRSARAPMPPLGATPRQDPHRLATEAATALAAASGAGMALRPAEFRSGSLVHRSSNGTRGVGHPSGNCRRSPSRSCLACNARRGALQSRPARCVPIARAPARSSWGSEPHRLGWSRSREGRGHGDSTQGGGEPPKERHEEGVPHCPSVLDDNFERIRRVTAVRHAIEVLQVSCLTTLPSVERMFSARAPARFVSEPRISSCRLKLSLARCSRLELRVECPSGLEMSIRARDTLTAHLDHAAHRGRLRPT